MTSASDVLAGLVDRQDRVVTHLDHIQDLLHHPSDVGAQAIAATRWQLVRAMLDYQMFKHRRLFDPVMAGSDAARAATAGRMKGRCITTAELFKAHLTRWSPTGSLERWVEYRAAEMAIIDRVRAQVSDERAAAPAMLAVSPDRQAWRAPPRR